jgi:eight-cysteine-cluster-containing protein
MPRIGIVLLALTSACTCPPRAQDTTIPVSPPPGEPPPTPPPPPGPSGARKPAVDKANPHYARVEGESFKNECTADNQCFVGGCSSEVCSAEEGVSTTCEMPAEGWPIQGATCGCLAGACQWFKAAAGPGPGGPGVAQGQSCKDAACATGLTCVKYFGIAGPSGPEFATCEVPCPDGADAPCPQGQKCITIADGPGQVCR